ncbi:MAG: hypothetical protein CL532_01610 [Aestuariivita sp.]|nr:hypothetical protein [Aestuariivita sp.]
MKSFIFKLWIWFGIKVGFLPTPTKGKNLKFYMTGTEDAGLLTTHFSRDALSFQRGLRQLIRE